MSNIDKEVEDYRPWGFYKVLLPNGNENKVKRIHVSPGKKLSLQLHHCRNEHWYIIQGKGVVTINNKKISVKKGDSLDIPVETIHRIENTGKEELVFIEIQTGFYLGEDDIERLE